MSEITRREAVTRIAVAFAAAGVVERADCLVAHELHDAVQEAASRSGVAYVPKALTARQFLTLERLTDLIIPVENGKPGAVRAEVAAWIDLLLGVNDDLKNRYTTGLSWIDAAMKERGAADFLSATRGQRTALLDVIAYQRHRSPALDPGIDFFILVRRMTVGGFYTSRIGMRDIYMGNTPRAAFTVPPEALEYVLNRSPFK